MCSYVGKLYAVTVVLNGDCMTHLSLRYAVTTWSHDMCAVMVVLICDCMALLSRTHAVTTYLLFLSVTAHCKFVRRAWLHVKFCHEVMLGHAVVLNMLCKKSWLHNLENVLNILQGRRLIYRAPYCTTWKLRDIRPCNDILHIYQKNHLNLFLLKSRFCFRGYLCVWGDLSSWPTAEGYQKVRQEYAVIVVYSRATNLQAWQVYPGWTNSDFGIWWLCSSLVILGELWLHIWSIMHSMQNIGVA
jgi:hypothetical protein